MKDDDNTGKSAKTDKTEQKETKKERKKRVKYEESINLLAGYLAREGKSQQYIADVIGISLRTLHRWQKVHKDLKLAIAENKELATDTVEESLFLSATGYYKKEEVAVYDRTIKKFQKTKVKKWYQPNPASLQFWLKNMRKDIWNEQKEDNSTQPIEIVITDYRGTQTKKEKKESK